MEAINSLFLVETWPLWTSLTKNNQWPFSAQTEANLLDICPRLSIYCFDINESLHFAPFFHEMQTSFLVPCYLCICYFCKLNTVRGLVILVWDLETLLGERWFWWVFPPYTELFPLSCNEDEGLSLTNEEFKYCVEPDPFQSQYNAHPLAILRKSTSLQKSSFPLSRNSNSTTGL